MTTATVPYKVSVRLGQAEFSAEGPEDTVKEQLNHFFNAATSSPFSPQLTGNDNASPSNGNGHANGNGSNGSNGCLSASSPVGVDADLSSELLRRLFEDDGKIVSVKRLPVSEDRDADVLFLILLGYLTLRDQEKVKASDMLVAAKQSGIRLSRIDHVLDKYEQLVTRGGFKRGSWYCLTNPGQEHAKIIASRIFS